MHWGQEGPGLLSGGNILGEEGCLPCPQEWAGLQVDSVGGGALLLVPIPPVLIESRLHVHLQGPSLEGPCRPQPLLLPAVPFPPHLS